MTPSPRWPRPLILAHRGFHRKVRENTREAILAARDVGADGVEFDVRGTADGAQILHHNRTRLIGGRQRPVSLLTRRALPSWVPLFETVLRRMRPWHDFVIDVELKEEAIHPTVLRVLREVPKHRLVVTSFHLPVCREIAKALPGVTVGWLREKPRAADVSRARRAGCKVLIAHRRGLRPNVASAAKRHRVQLWAWGINTVRRARAAVALGVTGLITDRPDLLLAADLRRPAPRRTSPRRGRRGS